MQWLACHDLVSWRLHLVTGSWIAFASDFDWDFKWGSTEDCHLIYSRIERAMMFDGRSPSSDHTVARASYLSNWCFFLWTVGGCWAAKRIALAHLSKRVFSSTQSWSDCWKRHIRFSQGVSSSWKALLVAHSSPCSMLERTVWLFEASWHK